MKKSVIALMVALTVLGVSGCGKEIDVATVNAKQVPGTNNLWYFCHETTLIYIEKVTGDDSYEAFFAWGCTPDGKLAKGWPESTAEGQGNGEK